MNPILIVLLATSLVVAIVLIFGRKKAPESPAPEEQPKEAESETEPEPAPEEEEETPEPEAEEETPSDPEAPKCPVCPICPPPAPCPMGDQEPHKPIRIILETVGAPLAHQNQIVLREDQYRPLYTPVDPSLWLKNPIVRRPTSPASY